MPAKSEEQRTKFCIALAIKQGKTRRSYSAECAEIADSMSEETLKDYCESPIKKE
jgi:hypothetical protein